MKVIKIAKVSHGRFTSTYHNLLSNESIKRFDKFYTCLFEDLSPILQMLNEIKLENANSSFYQPEPGKFKDGPQTVRIKINETVRLSCSYYHQVGVEFRWIKDNAVVSTGSYRVAMKTVVATGLNAGSNLTTQYLEFNISKGEEQGYYWCRIDDSVLSTQATVFLKGTYKRQICCLIRN